MENNSNQETQETSPMSASTQVVVGDGPDDGFENFFNNESLSDRILHICETEKVEYYSCGTYRKGKRSHEDAFDETEISMQRPIKQEHLEEENMMGCARYQDCDLRQTCKSVIEQNLSNIKVEEEDFDEQVNVDVVEIITPSNTDESQTDEPQVTDEKMSEEDEEAKQDENADGGVAPSNGSPEIAGAESPVMPGDVETTNINSQDDSAVVEKIVEQTAPEASLPSVLTEVEDEAEDVGEPTQIQVNCTDEDVQQLSEVPTRTYTLEKKVLRETRVFVHSIILAAKSDFFKCLFSTSGMKETRQQEVKLEVGRNETDTMLIMLRCFYNRNFINHQSLDVVINVCSLAMKYCFDGLIDKCLEVLANRAGSITEIEDFNRINMMVGKIQADLHQHKGKCNQVLKKFHSFLVKTFSKLDECLEVVPCKLFQLGLEAMHLFIDPYVQGGLDSPHGNLFLYAMQRWVRNHQLKFNLNSEDATQRNITQTKKDTFNFIEKLLNSVSLTNVTSDFLTNVMNYEISPFNIWPGYKEWYIRALQSHIYKTISRNPVIKNYPVLTRQREMKYARQEKNADIFSMSPVILNGFEIGIYLRVREDRKLHMLCKCKNLLLNKVGFDRAVLTFTIKGLLKLNTNSTLWKEPFPRQFASHPAASMFTDRFAFSYKQNTMCLQMYSLCRLSPAVYNIAKRNGFLIEFDIQYIN